MSINKEKIQGISNKFLFNLIQLEVLLSALSKKLPQDLLFQFFRWCLTFLNFHTTLTIGETQKLFCHSKTFLPMCFDNLMHFFISRLMILKMKFRTFTKFARIVRIKADITMVGTRE